MMSVDIHIESSKEAHGISTILIICGRMIADVIPHAELLMTADSVCFLVWVHKSNKVLNNARTGQACCAARNFGESGPQVH